MCGAVQGSQADRRKPGPQILIFTADLKMGYHAWFMAKPQLWKHGYEEIRLQVRYAETDQMGWVYYSNYLIWFEVGRTHFCRARGFTYAQLEKESETYLPVAECRCRYRKPLRYDEEFLVLTRVREFKRRFLSFEYQIVDLEKREIFAEGETGHFFVDENGAPKKLPSQYWHYFQKGTENGALRGSKRV